MTNNDSETVQSRRGVLSAVATATLFGGCLTAAEEADPPAVRAESDSSTPETQTQTPTPTVAEGPNETEYPVDHPNERANKDYGPLFSHDHGGVHPVRSRAEWQQFITEGPTHDSEGRLLDYEFITRTDFDSETVVIVEQKLVGGEKLRLQSVEGIGTPHLWLKVYVTGEEIYNLVVERYVFVRLPTKIEETKRITAEVRHRNHREGWADTQTEYYAYWDGSSRTQTDVRTHHDPRDTQQNRTDHTTRSNPRRGARQ